MSCAQGLLLKVEVFGYMSFFLEVLMVFSDLLGLYETSAAFLGTLCFASACACVCAQHVYVQLRLFPVVVKSICC